ncbi:MED7 protein-domain-containing protein [Spinellus fusiger]|nr:MED7 protein-domain-containing protein [Spinellus fusiger]
MAEQQSTGSAWPNPPSFYKRYTEENLESLKSAKKNNALLDTVISQPPLPDFYLHSLAPPAPPADSYKIFDQTWQVEDKLATLKELGVKQLFPSESIDRVQELKKLNRALIAQYLSLLDVLVHNPDEFGKRIENISTIFINMHHILNEYRPHQARETLKLLMENQVAKKRQQTAELQRKSKEALQMLNLFGREIEQSLANHVETGSMIKMEPGGSDGTMKLAHTETKANTLLHQASHDKLYTDLVSAVNKIV